MISSISSAMDCIAGALDRFDHASRRLAQPASRDLVRDRVDQITAQRTLEANLSTVRSADDMLGAPLDITA